METKNKQVRIVYCRQCGWLLRATWLAQELLTTFGDEIEELSLAPGTGGIFEVYAGGTLVWNRKEEGRFPEAKELKIRVRDRIAPGRNLARKFHRLSAATADLFALTALRDHRRPQRMSIRPRPPKFPKHCHYNHLHRLATKPGEISGLGHSDRVSPDAES